ncbi:MAG: hypothetical protein ACRD4Q_10190 [Candidatus Acidiferrales bacterium]
MSTITFPLSVMSYNTHLFGDLLMFKVTSVQYKDDPRCDALKQYLFQGAQRPADLVALQEVWSGSYGGDFKTQGGKKKDGSAGNYPYFYSVNDKSGDFAQSGLVLLGAQGAQWNNNSPGGYFNYIENCNNGGFDSQDQPIPGNTSITGKGYIYAACQLTNAFNSAIPSNAPVNIGIFTTHMVTNAARYPLSVKCCFESLMGSIQSYRNNNKSAGIIFAGDLNIDWDAPGTGVPKDGYNTYVVNILQNGGLMDAFAQATGNAAGYTVDSQNTLWQHFNGGATSQPMQERIDYVFYMNSQDGTVQFTSNSASVLNPAYFSGQNVPDPIQIAASGVSLDVSDHYPLSVNFTVTVTTR